MKKYDFTKFHNDQVENNTVDGMERNQAQSIRSESSSTETTSTAAVATARMSGEENSDRTHQKWNQIVSRAMVITLGSNTWSLRQVLSCYMSATA